MVVGLNLHDDAEAVADIDGAGVFRTAMGENVRAFSGEKAEKRLGVLVTAVLAPEGAEEAEFNLVWFAAELLDDQVVFGAGEGDGIENGLVDGHA
jgi:hypothetical protein